MFCSRRAHTYPVTAHHGAPMSLIKSVDVPKHMADRLRSRRIAARLSGGAKQPTVPTTKPLAVPPFAPAPPMRRPRPNCLVPPSCSTFSAAAACRKPRFILLICGKAVTDRTVSRSRGPSAPFHPKDEHKSVPWVQDTAWAGDLWCGSTSFHTDSPSALTGFPVKLGDVGEAHAIPAYRDRRERGWCS